MEYERALFRVYERSLDALRFDAPCIADLRFTKPSAICHFLLHFTWATAIFFLATTTCLHINFVGHPGCLGDALEAARPYVNGTAGPLMAKDDILKIRIRPGGDLINSYDPTLATNQSEVPPSTTEYTFVRDPPLLYLSPQFWDKHNVTVRTLTLDEYCVAGTPLLAWFVSAICGSYDTIVINQLLFSLRSDGALQNNLTNETWGWEASQLPPAKGYSAEVSVLVKLLVLLKALLAFVLISTVTALIVRMLMSSGVVLMFPLFYCLRGMGWHGLDLHLLTVSYPWLGVPIEQLVARNKPIAPFIVAHVTKVLVYYSMYEACQLLWAETLYGKSTPDGLQFWVYGLTMIAEYFSMIFVRSYTAIRYFPRVIVLYYLLFHFYFYSYVYGFFSEMLLAVFLLMVHAMVYTILFLELPACRRGDVSFEQPRALYTDVGIPAWPAALPPSWSLFLAVNSQSRPSGDIYREAVPERPGGMGGGGGGAGVMGAAVEDTRIEIELDGQPPGGGARAGESGGAANGGGPTSRGGPNSPDEDEEDFDGSMSSSSGGVGGAEDDRRSSEPMLRRYRRSSNGGSSSSRASFV